MPETTSTNGVTMSDRELDCWIDREVFRRFATMKGEQAFRYVSESESQSDNPWTWRAPVPHYSTDAAADYLVLVKVRGWDSQKIAAFNAALHRPIHDRWLKSGILIQATIDSQCARFLYEPGDYAKAAKAALEGK